MVVVSAAAGARSDSQRSPLDSDDYDDALHDTAATTSGMLLPCSWACQRLHLCDAYR